MSFVHFTPGSHGAPGAGAGIESGTHLGVGGTQGPTGAQSPGPGGSPASGSGEWVAAFGPCLAIGQQALGQQMGSVSPPRSRVEGR